MSLPAEIISYLQTEFASLRRLVCFLIDEDFQLLNWWGDAEFHGFRKLQAGEKMLERLPYLLGYSGSAQEVLPFISTADGRTIELHILPFGENFYAIVMDVSLEQDLHQKRQQSANEVRLLHAGQKKLINRQRTLIGDLIEAKTELDHRRREAERSIADKNQFIAMMSHEFRTPLSSIINYADRSLEKSTSTSDLRKSAEAIARASRHLNSLVETVLDDARLEAGKLTLNERKFEVRTLLDDLAAIMAPLAAEKSLSFVIYIEDAVPDYVSADDVCLRQILINLLGNAVKFTETGGVRLDVGWKKKRFHFQVSDTGPGIDRIYQERIFRAFERGTNLRATSVPGTGLGLTLSLELVRLMQGQIELVSDPGTGCTFEIVVPAAPAIHGQDQDTVLPEPAEKFHALRPATILLCDDDDDLLTLVEFYLHRAGYGLLLARNGAEAVEKALAYGPDLILMDINTPELSGVEAAAQLRKANFTSPIVALTASDIRRLDQKIFSGSLRKPIQMPRLLAHIQSYIQ